MWSNVISLDKQLDKETEYVIDSVRKINDVSYAVEESRERVFVYLASVCDAAEYVEEKILQVVETTILTYLKLRFFLDRLKGVNISHSVCALICSLVHFDRGYEGNLVRKALTETADFNVDGTLNFRLKAVTDNWEELCDLALRLLGDSTGAGDVFDVAAFITSTEGAKCRLAVGKGRLVNLTERRTVEILPLFDSDEYNLISAVIKERPAEILLDGADFSSSMNATLKRIAKIVTK